MSKLVGYEYAVNINYAIKGKGYHAARTRVHVPRIGETVRLKDGDYRVVDVRWAEGMPIEIIQDPRRPQAVCVVIVPIPKPPEAEK